MQEEKETTVASADTTVTQEDELERKKLEWILGFRKGRRALRATFKTFESDQKCAVCPKTVGIVSVGQIKLYCSKSCRSARHNALKRQ